MEQLAHPGDKKVADVLRKVLTHQFEDEFMDIAACGAAFSDRFGGSSEDVADHDPNGLVAAILDYRKSLREAPIQITPPKDEGSAFINSDLDSELTAQLYNKVVTMRKSLCSFHHLENWQREPWKRGGQATAILQRSKFRTTKGTAGKEHSLILLSAEMFPTKDLFLKATSYKDPVPVSDDLQAAAKWALGARQNSTILLMSDGRSKKIRKLFEEIVEEGQPDEEKQFDGVIVYAVPDQKDIRFPKRKTFGGLFNRETLAGIVPVPRVRMFSKDREHFSACGENSTYASSYTNVPMRQLGRLPRMTVPDKEAIVGLTLPT